jgi:two-component system OmpR family sensor kinase
MTKPQSLQRELNYWIILTSLIFVLIGGAIAGGIAFYQAQDFQDDILKDIGALLPADYLKTPGKKFTADDDEESVTIQELKPSATPTLVPFDIKDGLQTLRLAGEEWRVLAFTQKKTGRRFAIAQKTEVRGNIAWGSAIGVFLPIALLACVMLLLINIIIRRLFTPLGQLIKLTEKQDGTSLEELPDKDVPIEVLPFVHAINALLARYKEAMQRQRRFIADAAHELRTPIAALSLQADNLAKANTVEDNTERQKLLRQGLDRLHILVTQLLDIARLQSGYKSQATRIQFNQVVQDAVAELYPLAESRHIDLGMVRQERITVEDHDGRLSQLVTNAISNALNSRPAGGKVDISLFIENNRAIFTVEDTGIGIPEDQLQKVLSPFYRVQESLNPGNGLGLTISQEIALRLGGSITLSNRTGGGLCFRYEQPLPGKLDPSSHLKSQPI